MRPFFENKEITKVGHNLKFDIKVLFKYNIEVSGPLYDTMVAHYLINPDMRHNLDTLSESYLNYSPISIESLIGKSPTDRGDVGKNTTSRQHSLQQHTGQQTKYGTRSKYRGFG